MPLDDISELKRRVPGGKYALTRAIAERARQLQNGELPLTEVRTPNPLSVAIDEIMQGKVSFRTVDPATPVVPSGEAAAEAGTAAAPFALDETLAAKTQDAPAT